MPVKSLKANLWFFTLKTVRLLKRCGSMLPLGVGVYIHSRSSSLEDWAIFFWWRSCTALRDSHTFHEVDAVWLFLSLWRAGLAEYDEMEGTA